MPQFYPGETKTAKANMRNPAQKAFDYTGFLYMGTDLAAMSEVPFSLSAGQERQIIFPVVMPSVAGIYPVHLGVFSEGKNIALYRAEDVEIASPINIKTFHYVYQATYTWLLPPIIHAKDVTHIGFTIENKRPTPISGVSVKMRVEWPDYYWEEPFDPIGGGGGGLVLITRAGSVTLTAPLNQYLTAISQPFTAPIGDTGLWFQFSPGSLIPSNWTAGGPSPFTITVWVYIDGNLVAERTVITDVSYT